VIWWVQEFVRRWVFLNADAPDTLNPDHLVEVRSIVSNPVQRGQPYKEKPAVRQLTLLDLSRLHMTR
jgi:hypothetical protein